MTKRKQVIVILVSLLLLAGCGRRPGQPETLDVSRQEEGPAEEQTTPTPQLVPDITGTTILANGQLVAVNPPLPLSFETAGKVLEILVKAGDRVSAGDVIATLDDAQLRQTLSNTELAVDQAQNGLAQAQLALDDLLDWAPDEMAVSVAQANLEAAQAAYERAGNRDAAADNNLISARVSLNQAQRALDQAQDAYDNAWDEARDWEINYNEPICYQGQGGSVPCTGPLWSERIKNDRDFTELALQNAQEGLTVARANYALAQAGLSDNTALDAAAAVASAEQALRQAQSGPEESQIAAARLQVEQAEIALAQAESNLEVARQALQKASLQAPGPGTVLSVEATPGALAAAGVPIVTLLDDESVQFHTVNLSERDLSYVRPGEPVQLTLKSYAGQPIDGQVAYIVPRASGQVGDAATFTVVIDVDETELELLPGMTGRAEIQRAAE
ncbi:MAG: efflux RND transporter periplasmic adaptor subunit [Chloroflexota bacterium]|jgi:multidrug efflux pump subunit AcrA (membrane-fusion protein)